MKSDWALLSWLNVLVGAWLIVGPFVAGFAGWGYHESTSGFGGWIDYAVGFNVVFGILILAVSLAAALTDAPAASWTLVVLGLLLFWTPVVAGFYRVEPALWTDMLAVVLIELLAMMRIAIVRGETVRPARLQRARA